MTGHQSVSELNDRHEARDQDVVGALRVSERRARADDRLTLLVHAVHDGRGWMDHDVPALTHCDVEGARVHRSLLAAGARRGLVERDAQRALAEAAAGAGAVAGAVDRDRRARGREAGDARRVVVRARSRATSTAATSLVRSSSGSSPTPTAASCQMSDFSNHWPAKRSSPPRAPGIAQG